MLSVGCGQVCCFCGAYDRTLVCMDLRGRRHFARTSGSACVLRPYCVRRDLRSVCMRRALRESVSLALRHAAISASSAARALLRLAIWAFRLGGHAPDGCFGEEHLLELIAPGSQVSQRRDPGLYSAVPGLSTVRMDMNSAARAKDKAGPCGVYPGHGRAPPVGRVATLLTG